MWNRIAGRQSEPVPRRARPDVNLDLLRHALLLLNYREGVPAWAKRAGLIDARLAREIYCPACGKLGMEYHPFHRLPDRYVVVLSCGCGETMDF